MLGESQCTDSTYVSVEGMGQQADRRHAWRPWRPWRLRSQHPGMPSRSHNEFLAVFSHELRNSLGAIRSATSVLRTQDPAVVQARSLIERQVGQMTRLVEDLLDGSRVWRGKLRLQRERIDLRAVVAEAMQAVEHDMRQRHHRLSASYPDAPLWLRADSTRLSQVFVNLLVNAAKYTDDGGEITLSVGQEAGNAVVRIRDTGIGIAPDILPHVFDLFAQADPASHRADAGLGIGLAVVRGLVESHGGRVTVKSAGPHRGSEFTVRVPLTAA